MNQFDEATQLNPWPFIVGDVVLLVTASLIGSQSPAPLQGLPLIFVALCVALGAILAIIPFLVNHTQRQELALAERQKEIAALAQTTAATTEQLSIAASSLHGIAETAARNLKVAEQLPQKLQDKINEFKTQLNEVAVTENESLAQEVNTLRATETERLETALASIRKVVAELAASEAASRKVLAELKDAFAQASEAAQKSLAAAQHSTVAAIEKSLAKPLDGHDARPSAPKPARADIPLNAAVESISPFPYDRPAEPVRRVEPPSAVAAPPDASPAAPAVKTEPEAAAAPAAPSSSDERPARRRAPKKSVSTESELSLGIDIDESSQEPPPDATPAVSADGSTRLLVTAYIGIGNKLFVRGEGPGLSWENGVPLQFVSIGKWRWETADASAPVSLKLYKNDQQECTALGTILLPAGHQCEVTVNFN